MLSRQQQQENEILMELARVTVNSSPQPKAKIRMRDEILAMKEKERLGIDFNRSVKASLKTRWDMVEKGNADFLEDIVCMNDRVEEECRKHEDEVMKLIMTKTANLRMDTRIEQMNGILLHFTLYKDILEIKLEEYDQVVQFMTTCGHSMGYNRPNLLIDRHAALKYLFTELYADYEERMNELKRMQNELSDLKKHSSHILMIEHNTMTTLHERLKNLKLEVAQREYLLADMMQEANYETVVIFKISNAIHNIYNLIASYRNEEASLMDPMDQMRYIDLRLHTTIIAVKLVHDSMLSRGKDKRKKKRKSTLKTQDSLTSVISPTDPTKTDDQPHAGGTTVNQNRNTSGFLPPLTGLNMSSNKSLTMAKMTLLKAMRYRHQLARRPSSHSSTAVSVCNPLPAITDAVEPNEAFGICSSGMNIASEPAADDDVSIDENTEVNASVASHEHILSAALSKHGLSDIFKPKK